MGVDGVKPSETNWLGGVAPPPTKLKLNELVEVVTIWLVVTSMLTNTVV